MRKNSSVKATMQIEVKKLNNVNQKTNNENMKHYTAIKAILILAFLTLLIFWIYGSGSSF